MKALLILNDAPYGSERTYNGLRLAGSRSREENAQVRVFLIGVCGSCIDARGIGETELLEGARAAAPWTS
jgi:uncharacterized protein involved in oxidation of intracellular sulfur